MAGLGDRNVEIVLRQWRAWSAGDLEGQIRFYHPDVVVLAPEGWPEGPRFEGVEAWKRQSARLHETWEDASAEVDEIEAVGEDRVIVRLRYVTTGKDGIAFETPMATAFLLEGGLITRVEYFWEMSDAVRAAGEMQPPGRRHEEGPL
ncbi:MAG: nuclear transport factor 2 family protein [Solirubrobacterales bacterium]